MITIIGMLVALLLPAVQAVRENARQTQCMNNSSKSRLATVAHDTSKGEFPGYSQFIKRERTECAIIDYDGVDEKFIVDAKTHGHRTSKMFPPSVGRRFCCRGLNGQDIWDQIMQPPVDGS